VEGRRVSRDQVGVERRVSTSSFELVGRVVWKWRVRQRERCDRDVSRAMVCVIVWWLPCLRIESKCLVDGDGLGGLANHSGAGSSDTSAARTLVVAWSLKTATT
jgi:hypothetical protein